MLFIIVYNVNEVKNIYNIFKTICNSLNDVINIVNYIKCKLKYNVIKCKKLND